MDQEMLSALMAMNVWLRCKAKTLRKPRTKCAGKLSKAEKEELI
jgi:hypothetical protein